MSRKTKTYIDSSVYVLALKSKDKAQAERAIWLIKDSSRYRVASDILRVELLPTAVRRKFPHSFERGSIEAPYKRACAWCAQYGGFHVRL